MLHTKALLGYKIGIILKPPHLLKKLVFLEVCSTRLWCSQYWRPRQVTSYVHFTSFWSSVLPRTYWLHFVVFLVWFYFPTQTMIYYINDKKKKKRGSEGTWIKPSQTLLTFKLLLVSLFTLIVNKYYLVVLFQSPLFVNYSNHLICRFRYTLYTLMMVD